MKKIVYVDMDDVLVDFESGVRRVEKALVEQYAGHLDDIPGIFGLMDPVPGAIDGFKQLAAAHDVYILSTGPWKNPSSWSDKLQWVKKYLGDCARKRLILSHHKNLNKGDYLIDNSKNNGAGEFEGELIQFGSEQFPNWDSVLKYLL